MQGASYSVSNDLRHGQSSQLLAAYWLHGHVLLLQQVGVSVSVNLVGWCREIAYVSACCLWTCCFGHDGADSGSKLCVVLYVVLERDGWRVTEQLSEH